MLSNEYIAWVPCISGKIYFHDLTPGLGEFDLYDICCQDREDNTEFVISSVVDWRDNQKRDLPPQNFFRVVLTSTLKHNTLHGHVYIIDRTFDNTVQKQHPDYEYHQRPFFGNNSYFETKLLNRLDTIIDTPKVYNVVSDINDLISTSTSCFTHKVSFTLAENGVCNLTYRSSRDIRGRVFVKNESEAHDLVRYSFFYLRDCIHTHTHHEKQNDCMTEVHHKSGDTEVDAFALIDDLKKSLSEIRYTYKKSFHSYAGIAIYARSLVNSLLNLGWIKNKEKITEQEVYLDCMAQSIVYRGLNSTNSSNSLWDDFKITFKTTSVYLLAIIAPMLVFLNTASRVGVEYREKNLAEMKLVCDPMLPLLSHACKYVYAQAEDYMGGTLAPILKLLVLLLVSAIFISIYRIAGIQYFKGGRVIDTIQSSLRWNAYSHLGFWGNSSYKVVKCLRAIKFALPLRDSDGPAISLFKLWFFPLILCFLSICSFVLGIDHIGDPIPDSNISIVSN